MTVHGKRGYVLGAALVVALSACGNTPPSDAGGPAPVIDSPATPGPVEPAGRITEYAEGIAPNGALAGITGGPDGNVWFAEGDTNRIGRITPAGEVTEFGEGISIGPVDMGNPPGSPETHLPAGLQGITAGPDGNLWFTGCLNNRIGRITPAGEITEFAEGLVEDGCPTGIAAGPDGNLWYTALTRGQIGRITPTGQVTMFTLDPSDENGLNCIPGEITAGPDGNLWFTGCGTGIGRITPAGEVTYIEKGLPAHLASTGITAGPDGNMWFTDQYGPGVGRITPAGKVTVFTKGISPESYPHGIAAGPDGNIWFTEGEGPRIGRITPAGKVTEYSEGLTAKSSPSAITAGPDGNLWFTEYDGNRIGRISPGPTAAESTHPGPTTKSSASAGLPVATLRGRQGRRR